jgi:membrane protein YdbS with pleckstrin-like domain
LAITLAGGATTLRSVPLPRKFLNDDEEFLLEMRPHWVFFARPLFTAVVVVGGIIAILVAFSSIPNWATDVLLVLAAIPVLWLLGRLLRWRGYTLALTTTRIVVRRGVLGRNTTQIRLQRITEICLEQKLWERMISTGRFIIDVQGEDDAVVLEFIRKPAIVQRVINGQINEVCGGGRAEPIPQELFAYRRSWSQPEPEPEPERASDTPPFGTPVVPAQGDPWAASPPPRSPAPAPTGPSASAPTEPTTEPMMGGPAGPLGPAAGAPPQPTVVSGPGGRTAAGEIRDRLIELDDLRQRKIISEEEFAAKKAELLSRI